MRRRFCTIAILVCFMAGHQTTAQAAGSDYALTTLGVAHNSNWLAAVQAEFGAQATVADWDDLVIDFGDDPGALASLLGGNPSNSAYVTRGGSQYFDVSYVYFIQNHYGTVPGGWLVLDSLGDNVVDLGRWNSDNYRVLATNITLTGDLNGDGFVGQDDLNIVLGAWGTSVTPGDPLAGDPSGDGFVGQDDLNDVLAGWGQGTPPSFTVVPEPGSIVVLALAGLAVWRRR